MVNKHAYAGYEALLDPITVWERDKAPMKYKIISPMKGEEDTIIEVDPKLMGSEDFARLSNMLEDTDVSANFSNFNLILFSKHGE